MSDGVALPTASGWRGRLGSLVRPARDLSNAATVMGGGALATVFFLLIGLPLVIVGNQ